MFASPESKYDANPIQGKASPRRGIIRISTNVCAQARIHTLVLILYE